MTKSYPVNLADQGLRTRVTIFVVFLLLAGLGWAPSASAEAAPRCEGLFAKGTEELRAEPARSTQLLKNEVAQFRGPMAREYSQLAYQLGRALQNSDSLRQLQAQLTRAEAILQRRPTAAAWKILNHMIGEFWFRREFFLGRQAVKSANPNGGRGETPSEVKLKIAESLEEPAIIVEEGNRSHLGQSARIEGRRLEGQVASHIEGRGIGILSLNDISRDIDHGKQYETDIRLTKAFVEVTTEDSGKTQQILERYFSDFVNPKKIPVILYAANYLTKASIGLMEAARLLGLPFVIVRTPEELNLILDDLYGRG